MSDDWIDDLAGRKKRGERETDTAAQLRADEISRFPGLAKDFMFQLSQQLEYAVRRFNETMGEQRAVFERHGHSLIVRDLENRSHVTVALNESSRSLVCNYALFDRPAITSNTASSFALRVADHHLEVIDSGRLVALQDLPQKILSPVLERC